MAQRLGRFIRTLLAGERGQATVEYTLIVAVTIVLLLAVSGLVVGALATYYQETTSVVCLPIP